MKKPPSPPLTVEQKQMRAVYRAMQRALRDLFGFYGMRDPDHIMGPLTTAMDNLCTRWKIDPER